MNYNWISAKTAEGRERLKWLLDSGEVVPVRGKYKRGYAFYTEPWYKFLDFPMTKAFDLRRLKNIEFLDPDRDNEIATLKAENEQLVKICQDSVARDVVDKILYDRHVSELLAEIDRLKSGGKPQPDGNGLLPCPFCGESAQLLMYPHTDEFAIRCSDDSCHAYKQSSPAINWPSPQFERQKAKWNRRT